MDFLIFHMHIVWGIFLSAMLTKIFEILNPKKKIMSKNGQKKAFFSYGPSGVKHSASDPKMYVLYDAKTMVIVALYVGDLVIASNHKERLQNVKNQLQGKFNMKDLGKFNLSFCLDIQVTHNRYAGMLTIHQTKYTLKILRKCGQQNLYLLP